MPVQTILDGPRNVVVKATATAIESGILVDVSALDPPCTEVSIERVWFSCVSAQHILLTWDATADVEALHLHGTEDFCFDFFGGIPNNAGAGVTGDLLYSFELDGGTVIVHCVKRGIIDTPL